MDKLFMPLLLTLPVAGVAAGQNQQSRPNILFVVADDQSYPYASACGSDMVHTPAYDFVASNGIMFTQAYVTSPGSSPSRASMLTGRYPWQIEQAGTHASSFPSKYICFPDIFAQAGYATGSTGKGWAPGDWQVSGRKHNPAGLEYNERRLGPPYSGISDIDYASNFSDFLLSQPADKPFCFWFGAHEPHRAFEQDSWRSQLKALSDAEVPKFLPDVQQVRGDLLDYAVEIEWYDSQLMKIIELLKKTGRLNNTIIVVTADNGMSFPHAKANCYDAGVHVPLAVCWIDGIKRRSVVDDALFSTIDLAPTLLNLAGVGVPDTLSLPMQGVGRSDRLLKGKNDAPQAVFFGRERHSSSRHDNLGYPMRAVRLDKYLLVHNFHSERYPAGDPQQLFANGTKGKPHGAYFDIDDCPSKTYLIENQTITDIEPYFRSSVGLRNQYELYDLSIDAACMHDLSKVKGGVVKRMKKLLSDMLILTHDTRVGSNPEVWETYPRLRGEIRQFVNE